MFGAQPSAGSPAFTVSLVTKGRLTSVEEFEDIVVRAGEDGAIVRIRDLGRVEIGSYLYSSTSHFNGKGAALMTGFDAVLARASDADAVLVQDADLEYDPADYRALVATLGDPAVGAAFGNRWAGTERRAGYRRLHAMANGLLTAASNRATGLGVHDMECCYKLLRVPILRAARPWLSEERFGIEPQIIATVFAMRKSARTTALVAHWLRLCEDLQLIGDGESRAPVSCGEEVMCAQKEAPGRARERAVREGARKRVERARVE